MIIEFLRYVVVLQAAWVLGVALVTLPAYLKDRYFAHIGLVAASYSGLVLLATFRSWYGVFIPEVVYVPVVSVLIMLGDISLLVLLKRRRERRRTTSRTESAAVEFLAEFRDGTLVYGSTGLNVLKGMSEIAEVLPDGKYRWAVALDVDQAERLDL